MSMQKTTAIPGKLSVEAVGMVSSVGLTANSSCAAIRARISRFEEIPFHDKIGQPIIGAPVIEVVSNRQGYRRLAPMLCKAISECTSSYNHIIMKSKALPPLLIAIDNPERPDYPDDLSVGLLSDVQDITGIRLHYHSRVFAKGRAAFYHAIKEASQLLTLSEIDSCIVAGVDSLLNSKALQWLEDNGHLKTEYNSDGVIPGEAAAVLWLTKNINRKFSILDIVGLGFGEETSLLEKDAPNLAVGLSNALHNALADAGIPLHEINFRVAGMTGERLEFMEASTALARIQRVHKDNFDLLVPAEKIGEVGAALPACMMVITAVSFAKKYAPGRKAILFNTSSSAERAAYVVVDPGIDRSLQ